MGASAASAANEAARARLEQRVNDLVSHEVWIAGGDANIYSHLSAICDFVEELFAEADAEVPW